MQRSPSHPPRTIGRFTPIATRLAMLVPLLICGVPSRGAQAQPGEATTTPARDTAGAGTPGASVASEASEDRYKEALRGGVSAFEAEDWQQARKSFLQAHGVRPSCRTWRALGLTAFKLGLWPLAIVELERSLAGNIRPLTDAQRTEASAVLEKARAKVGDFALQMPSGGAAVRVDGHPYTLKFGQRLILPVGRHLVEVAGEGAAHWQTELTVKGGERATLEVTFGATQSSTTDATEQGVETRSDEASASPDSSREPKPAERPRNTLSKTLGWSLAGGALVALGSAVPLAFMTSSQRDLARKCSPDCDASVVRRGERLQLATNTLFFSGAALAIGSAVSWTVHARRQRAAVAFSKSGFTVGWSGEL